MKGINRILAVGGILSAMAAGSHTAYGRPVAPAQPVGPFIGTAVLVGPFVSEDDPRWQCDTMGNHRCGKYRTGIYFGKGI